MKTLLPFLLLAAAASAQAPPKMPMPNDYANSIWTRWFAKPVLDSRLIDDMENLSTWTIRNTGQAKAELTLTRDRSLQGASSLRFRSRSTGDTPVPTERYFGIATATRVVNNEDWSGYNRLSLWIYPDLPGFRVVSLLMSLRNDGTEKVPDAYGKMGKNYLILRNHEWNHVVWEIANLSRDKVTGVELTYLQQGHEPAASDIVTFDFDKLELQKVKADHYKGWNVAPGEIAFSHSGYQIGATRPPSPATSMRRTFSWSMAPPAKSCW
jgi:hypothetical protein